MSAPAPAVGGASASRLRPAARSPRLALAGALLVALVLFQLVYGVRLLNARDAYWTNPHGDMGQMLAGELAGLREPWSLPLLVTRTLTAPDPVSLVYTDSIPWLTALLKLTHLGPVLSLLGTFLLLAWLAQAAAMYALLRASGVERRSTLFAGAVLALLVPSFLGRQLGHIALSGHAVQIAALALAVHGVRRGVSGRTVAGFIGLGVLAVGVHAYHVPPVTLMFLAALASNGLQGRPGAGRRAAVAVGAYLLVLVAAAWVAGYFVGRGESGGVAALGYYEMNVVAPVLPQGSWLAGQRWNGGWFTGVFDPTGGEVFEGFNYLGAGILLVLLAALAAWSAGRRRTETSGGGPAAAGIARRWGPLTAGLVLLTLYAIGPQGWFGPWRLWRIPLADAPWTEPLALFRCQGRFFWTVGYALLEGGLVVVDRSAGRRLRPILLATVVALQAGDMSQMLVGLHERFSAPEPLGVPRVLLGPAFHGRDYRFYPGFFCTDSWANQLVVSQLSLMAQRQQASTNSSSTARRPPGACRKTPPSDALVDAPPGDRRITVLMSDDGRPSAVTNLFTRRNDCVSMTTFWMCGRELRGLPQATSVRGVELLDASHTDATLAVGSPPFASALVRGWSKPEPTGVWSDGAGAVLRLPHADVPPGASLSVSLDALGYQPPRRPPQRAFVSVRGRRLAEWRLDGGGYHGLQVAVPSDLLTSGAPLEVAIDLPDALSPNDVLPGSGDPRRLGIGVRRITLAH